MYDTPNWFHRRRNYFIISGGKECIELKVDDVIIETEDDKMYRNKLSCMIKYHIDYDINDSLTEYTIEKVNTRDFDSFYNQLTTPSFRNNGYAEFKTENDCLYFKINLNQKEVNYFEIEGYVKRKNGQKQDFKFNERSSIDTFAESIYEITQSFPFKADLKTLLEQNGESF